MSSEQDSEGSNLESLQGTPYSSPLQQVPESGDTRRMSYSDDKSLHSDRGNVPYLAILIQPQNQYRFRYKSERASGTHGCLNGNCKTPEMTKTYPTVQLKNYTGNAIIKCKLYRHDTSEEHPHNLYEEDQGDNEPSFKVPVKNSFTVCFRGLGIIHTAKKDVPDWLYKKIENQIKKEDNKKKGKKDFRQSATYLECKVNARAIDLNKVRLRFSAHDFITDKEICKPEYSEVIYNMKSAETNTLTICDSSRCSGRPSGGDDVIFLVEKVKKGNIRINFFEVNSKGRVWEAPVFLKDSDIHHQYGIKFRTPAYKNVEITDDVTVFMELQRQSDGATSLPLEFKYVADKHIKYKLANKRRRLDSSSVSLPQSPASSIPSVNSDTSTMTVNTPQIPIENEMAIHNSEAYLNTMSNFENELPQSSNSSLLQSTTTLDQTLKEFLDSDVDLSSPECHNVQQHELGEVISEYFVVPMESQNEAAIDQQHNLINNPMLGQPNVPNPVNQSLMTLEPPFNSSYTTVDNTEFNTFQQQFYPHMQEYSAPYDVMELFPDSGRPKQGESSTKSGQKSHEGKIYINKKEGLELKRLSLEVCKLMSDKPSNWKQDVKRKLERLLKIRMSNGDTFLHMTLSSSPPSLRVVVSALQAVGLAALLDSINDEQQTVLHLAVIQDLPDVVSYLVDKGCNPMCADKDRNTALHHAVKCEAMLRTLLEAVEKKGIENFNLDAFNREWQTPLHLATIYGLPASVRLLLKAGADRGAEDYHGRTEMHIAVLDDRLAVLEALLEDIQPRDINLTESRKWMTPLQLACAGNIRPNTLAIIKLLLEKGADSCRHEDSNLPAWKLAQRHPQMWEVVKNYLPETQTDGPVNQCDGLETKSDSSTDLTSSEDEFESADEGVSDAAEDDIITTKLNGMSLLQEVVENA